jgi:phosphoribosylanthranilate isomerase
VTEPADIELLGRCGVDGVGLWHGVPGGEAELSRTTLARRAAHAHACAVEPVLVTFAGEAGRLAGLARACRVKYLQLHAYQLPKVVQTLRRPGLHIVKVLHVRGGRCVEEPLIGAYERAGVDSFLLDVTSHAGCVGSTGETLPPDVASRVAGRLQRPFYLAGGITGAGRETYAELLKHPGFRGIDVSTGARDGAGLLCPARITAIDEAWRGVGVH